MASYSEIIFFQNGVVEVVVDSVGLAAPMARARLFAVLKKENRRYKRLPG